MRGTSFWKKIDTRCRRKKEKEQNQNSVRRTSEVAEEGTQQLSNLKKERGGYEASDHRLALASGPVVVFLCHSVAKSEAFKNPSQRRRPLGG